MDVGGFNWNEIEPKTFESTVSVPNVGAGLLMTRFDVIEPVKKLPLASCAAVMATVPLAIMETVFPATVAIAISADV